MKGLNLDVLIADDIRSAIEMNKYPAESKLPSEKKLCEMYGVQKLTIRSSLQILKDEGMIYSKDRSGYYVQKGRIVKDLRNFQSSTDVIKNMGRESEIEILRFELTQAGKTAAQLMDIQIGTSLYSLDRLRKVDGKPVSIEKSYLMADYFPNLEQFDFTQESLYHVFENEYDVFIDRTEKQLSVVHANDMMAELLQVDKGSPLIKEHGLVFDNENKLIECIEDFMLIDSYIFIR